MLPICESFAGRIDALLKTPTPLRSASVFCSVLCCSGDVALCSVLLRGRFCCSTLLSATGEIFYLFCFCFDFSLCCFVGSVALVAPVHTQTFVPQ